MSKVKSTLEDRGQVYGENWYCYEGLKSVVSTGDMDAKRRYCMDMILMKISRLSAGKPHDYDTWHDIAGYAMLAAEGLEELSPDRGMMPDEPKVRGGVVL